jgi:hypothetical protein
MADTPERAASASYTPGHARIAEGVVLLASNSCRPIFVLGCPGSGTSLLRRMLHNHPRIAIPPETRFLLSAYEHRDAYGDLRELENRKALAEWIVAGAGTRFGDLGLSPRKITDEIVAGPPTLGSALGIVLRGYARQLGRPRWGDSRPGYVQYIDALLGLFPNAQIVHVIRDGRDCVAALKRMRWWRMPIHHSVATWTQAIDAGQAAARRLPPGAYTETRYEQLIADPAGSLRVLCGFLREEYDPAMARPAKSVSPTTWTRTLDLWELELCETAMAERLTEYGYTPSGAGRPAARHMARYAAVVIHRRLAARKRTLRDQRIRDGERPIASLLPGSFEEISTTPKPT